MGKSIGKVELKHRLIDYIKEMPYSSMKGFYVLNQPKHALLPDYPYGYTARGFKVVNRQFVYCQIMWDFETIKKELVGVKESMYPFDREEIAWTQGERVFNFNSPEEVALIEDLVPPVLDS